MLYSLAVSEVFWPNDCICMYSRSTISSVYPAYSHCVAYMYEFLMKEALSLAEPSDQALLLRPSESLSLELLPDLEDRDDLDDLDDPSDFRDLSDLSDVFDLTDSPDFEERPDLRERPVFSVMPEMAEKAVRDERSETEDPLEEISDTVEN